MKNIDFTFKFLVCFLVGFSVFSQSILISPNNGSKLIESNSTNKAVQLPSVAATSAITSPQKGMVVFDDATGTMSYFNGSTWIPLSNSSTGWAVAGNTLNSTNSGNVGIGEPNPSAKLHVKTGESGASVPPFANSAFENGTHNILSILSPDNRQSGVVMVHPTQEPGGILYNENEELSLLSGGATALTIENEKVGIGTTNPTSKVHIKNGSSGVSPNSNPDVLIEDDDHSYLNLVTPANRESGILFGLPSNGTSGGIVYNNAGKKAMQFRTDNNTNQMTIDSTGKMILRTGEIQAGNHLLRLNNNGLFSSYNSSLNIAPLAVGEFNKSINETVTNDGRFEVSNFSTFENYKIGNLITSTQLDVFNLFGTGLSNFAELTINLDPAISSRYDKLLILSDVSLEKGYNDHTSARFSTGVGKIFIDFDTGLPDANRVLTIKFIIYGVLSN